MLALLLNLQIARLMMAESLLVGASATAKPLHLTRLAAGASGVAYWSRAGDWFLAQSRDGEALLKYARDGRALGRVSLASAHGEVSFDLDAAGEQQWYRPALSSDDKTLLFCDEGEQLWRLDVMSGKVARVDNHGRCAGLVWLPDNKRALITRWDRNYGHYHQVVDVFSGRVEHTCWSPFRVAPELLDEAHGVLFGDRLYAASLDCGGRLDLTARDDEQRGRPIAIALSPDRRRFAVLMTPARPTAGSHVSLWIYSRATSKWTAVARETYVARFFAWLDDDTLLFEELRGPDGSDSGTLQRYSVAEDKVSVAVPPVVGCIEAGLSAPRNGGVVAFQRQCINEDSWQGLLTR
jgi:hypothetical protein